MYLTPRWGDSPWNWVSAQGVKKLKWRGYQLVENVLRWVQSFRHNTYCDKQPAPSQPRRRSTYRAYYVARVKSAERKRKHCALTVVMRNQNFRPAADPLPGGAGLLKFNQMEIVTTFTNKMQFGEDRWTQFRVIVVIDPRTQTDRHRQDWLQYTAPQLTRSVNSYGRQDIAGSLCFPEQLSQKDLPKATRPS